MLEICPGGKCYIYYFIIVHSEHTFTFPHRRETSLFSKTIFSTHILEKVVLNKKQLVPLPSTDAETRNLWKIFSQKYPSLISTPFQHLSNFPMNMLLLWLIWPKGIGLTCHIYNLIKSTINKVPSIKMNPICSIAFNYVFSSVSNFWIQTIKQIP